MRKLTKIAQSFSDVELVQTTFARNHPVFDEFVALAPNDVSTVSFVDLSVQSLMYYQLMLSNQCDH